MSVLPIGKVDLSAVPALEQGDARGAQTGGFSCRDRGNGGGAGVDGRKSGGDRPRAGAEEPEGQLLEEPAAALRADHRLAPPVRCRPVTQVGVQGRSRARSTMLVVGAWLRGTGLDERDEPVPVQQGHIVGRGGRGMPSQEMIVVGADLAGRVMVADIVIVGLRQWDVDRAENQHADSQGSQAMPL